MKRMKWKFKLKRFVLYLEILEYSQTPIIRTSLNRFPQNPNANPCERNFVDFMN